MECIAQKKKGSNINDDGEDRITELPEKVKVHILSFLPTIDAVNTMLLRSFGNLWTQIPSLKFDTREIIYDIKQLLEEYDDIEEDLGFKDMLEGFASYVRNALFYHKRVPIDEFELVINVFDWLNGNFEGYKKLGKFRKQAISEINQWIRFAIDREVKVLELGFYSGGVDASVLPSCVFTSKFLVKLHIYGCGIKHVGKVHMETLEDLSLEHVEISNEVFKELVSGCPSLQSLDIKFQIGLNEIRFSNPSIKSLFLNEIDDCLLDCPNLEDLLLMDSYPNVVDVSSLHEVCAYSD